MRKSTSTRFLTAVSAFTIIRVKKGGKQLVACLPTIFQAGCIGFHSRLPLQVNLGAMKSETYHGWKSGLVAQGQSGRLITGWSQVRILPSPFRSRPDKEPVLLINFAR